MSVQTNQYLMWGVQKPMSWVKEWEAINKKDADDFDGFYEHFEKFCDASAFKMEIKEEDGIFCLYDGMNGKYIIVGKVLAKTTDDRPFLASGVPMGLKKPKRKIREQVADSIKRNFGIEDECSLWFVTYYC